MPSMSWARVSRISVHFGTCGCAGSGSKPRVIGASSSRRTCQPGSCMNSLRPFIAVSAKPALTPAFSALLPDATDSTMTSIPWPPASLSRSDMGCSPSAYCTEILHLMGAGLFSWSFFLWLRAPSPFLPRPVVGERPSWGPAASLVCSAAFGTDCIGRSVASACRVVDGERVRYAPAAEFRGALHPVGVGGSAASAVRFLPGERLR
mmetsp:Transcript_70016/g.221065  ORF Transcript_70016/g.221065 Transcript_70016/m.221065 type:complete len:206 (-) Transcript_70016:278-895(-)